LRFHSLSETSHALCLLVAVAGTCPALLVELAACLVLVVLEAVGVVAEGAVALQQ
jgi:hypothetical protein